LMTSLEPDWGLRARLGDGIACGPLLYAAPILAGAQSLMLPASVNPGGLHEGLHALELKPTIFSYPGLN
jgi:hypothetical protein